MNATRTKELAGIITTQWYHGPDPGELTKNGGGAKVGSSAGYALSFGAAKCGCWVELSCDQSVDTIKQAKDISFALAHQFALDGIQEMAKDCPSIQPGDVPRRVV